MEIKEYLFILFIDFVNETPQMDIKIIIQIFQIHILHYIAITRTELIFFFL